MAKTLIKEGLYLNAYNVTFGTLTYTVWELSSANGYCFYDLDQSENYDEEGNLLAENDLVYATYIKMRADEARLTRLIVVPIKAEYNIV